MKKSEKSGSKLIKSHSNPAVILNSKEGTKTVHYMESNLKQIFSALEPQITPLTDTLLYSYDYGDGWCVRVTCTEGYYINDSWIIQMSRDMF